MKLVDPSLHKEYTLEKFKDGHAGKNFVTKEPKFDFKKPQFKKTLSIGLPKASTNLEATKYLESRKLNSNKFYYTDKFKKWTNTLVHTFDDITHDDERIIIPLIYDGEFVGYQGRSLGPSKVKYITVMLNDDAPKIYGLDTIDKNRVVYVTEGPFDSTFIDNACAMCGADGDLNRWGISDPVWIYDNEPRNKEIVARIASKIESGNSVVIYPESIDLKDINDMILSGLDVQSLVESNTYVGLQAQLKFTNWKKI